MSYVTVPLNASHKKSAFNCGNALLDNYLHVQAKQDVKRKLAACLSWLMKMIMSKGTSLYQARQFQRMHCRKRSRKNYRHIRICQSHFWGGWQSIVIIKGNVWVSSYSWMH